MNRRRTLNDLCAALRGDPRPAADWRGMLELANGALVTPQIHAAALAHGALERIPDEVTRFTAEVQSRNAERNRRLARQLTESVGALNRAGITPTLLKGAALWFAGGELKLSDRMLNDLDLLVRPHEAQATVAALVEAGFDLINSYPGNEVHVVAELGRPSDVGFIDLHQRPPGPPGMAEMAALDDGCRTVTWEGVTARVPTPTVQAFLLVLHDQFHDGDYWRGGFTLRHLIDLAALTAQPIDWDLLNRLARTPLVRHALQAQLLAAHRLFGAQIPASIARSPWAHLQHARHMAQFCWPKAGKLLAVAGVASEAPALLVHRRINREDRRQLFGEQAAQPLTLSARVHRLQHIMGGFAAGKI